MPQHVALDQAREFKRGTTKSVPQVVVLAQRMKTRLRRALRFADLLRDDFGDKTKSQLGIP